MQRVLLLFLALSAGVLGLITTEATAQDGLSRREIEYYCSLGSQTPYSVRQYCGGGRRARRDDGYYGGGYGGGGGRPLSPRELDYYCRLGDQTPISARSQCIRSGYYR